VNLLLEGTPREIDLGAVKAEIESNGLVTGVHDLHVWALSSDEMALSCHVVIGECPLGDAEHVVRGLEARLCDRFAIGHTTIQVESCHPCGEIQHGAGSHNHPHEDIVLSQPAGAGEPPRAAGSSAPPR
jgi:cobalt-zinc-cadmium efflux system protein